jgi:hypothetical protein
MSLFSWTQARQLLTELLQTENKLQGQHGQIHQDQTNPKTGVTFCIMTHYIVNNGM